jgi:O-antigen ligase
MRSVLAFFCVLACLLSLIVIKGRFIAAFTFVLVSLLPLFELRPGWRRALPYLIVIGLVGYAVLGVAALGGQPAVTSIVDRLWAYGTLDTGGGQLATLTGRTPLWDELLRYATAQPWAGYGFGAFWNPVFMPDIWSVVGWEPPVAHNGFLDEVLATGVIGLVLFLVAWLTGVALAARLRFKHKDAFSLWVLTAMVFFLLCNLGDSLMQTYARFPFWISLTALFALLGVHAREEIKEARLYPT